MRGKKKVNFGKTNREGARGWEGALLRASLPHARLRSQFTPGAWLSYGLLHIKYGVVVCLLIESGAAGAGGGCGFRSEFERNGCSSRGRRFGVARRVTRHIIGIHPKRLFDE